MGWAFPPVLHWGGWALGPVWGSKAFPKQSEPGDTLAGLGDSQGKQGEAVGARVPQPERRKQRGIQWPLLLVRDILGAFGMGSARGGTAASREAPASPKEKILILTNSLLTPCLKKSASSQPLLCCKLSPEHWQSHSLLFSQDFSMLLAD